MAFSELRPSGRYRGGYRDANGQKRYIEGTFARAKQAKDAATVAEHESRSLGWRDPKAAKRVYADWVHEWWGARTVEPSTMRADLIKLNLHVLPKWGDQPLIGIKRGDVKTWANELAATPLGRVEPEDAEYGEIETLSPSTVLKIVYLLSASLQAAVDDGILEYNPASRLKLPPPGEPDDRFLTHAEFAKVLAHLPTDHDRLIAELLVSTGMRFGELAGAHWHRVNEVAGTLLVVDTWDVDDQSMKPYPKGKRSRDVPVPVELLGRLAGVERPDVCGQRHRSGKCRSGLLLVGERNSDPLNVGWWGQHRWAPAVEKAKVGHCRVHDLRHTYASWLIQSGHSLAEVGKLLGHVSTQTTARYAHLLQADHSRVMAALKAPTDSKAATVTRIGVAPGA